MRIYPRRLLTVTAIGLLAIGAGGTALAKPGAAGWQTAVTINVSTGETDFFQHIACPTGFTAQSGGFFALTSATIGNGFALTGSGPRLDLTPPAYDEWAWNFVWPNGGAPAGSQLIFNLTCKKGKP